MISLADPAKQHAENDPFTYGIKHGPRDDRDHERMIAVWCSGSGVAPHMLYSEMPSASTSTVFASGGRLKASGATVGAYCRSSMRTGAASSVVPSK